MINTTDVYANIIKRDYDSNYMKVISSDDLLKQIIWEYLICMFPNVSGCTSSVIDSKIEQAMEALKNHLIYIMRDEVQVLKDRISILLERIEQLEIENEYLRAHASPEVLKALSSGTFKSIEFVTATDDAETLEASKTLDSA